jgi:hypothetical protein
VPEISRFFGIIIRMFYDDHAPPHIHVEAHGSSALFDFEGNILKGSLQSRTATRLVRDWIDIHKAELQIDWSLAQNREPLNWIRPLE